MGHRIVRLRKPVRSVTVRAPKGVKVNVKRKKHNPIYFEAGRQGVAIGYYRKKTHKKH